jgi:ribosomal protein L37AE/L43A
LDQWRCGVTRREELLPEIRRLRDVEGLMWREIGARLGLAKATVHDYYSDPTGEAARARKVASDERTAGVCEDCGGRTGPRRKGCARCRKCNTERKQGAWLARLEGVAELYRDGKSYREIADHLGYGPSSHPPEISYARRLGLIGYRNRGYGAAA